MRRYALAGVVLASLAACSVPDSQQDELLIENVRIVSPDSLSVGDATSVLIRGDKIDYVGDDAGDRSASNALRLDASGYYLLPGLIDSHTHLNEVPGMSFDHERTYAEIAAEARRQIPRSYLYHGFTTVIDLNGHPDAIAKWNAMGVRPTAYFCGASPVHDGYPMSFMPKPDRYRMMPYFLFDETRADEFPDGYSVSAHSPAAVVRRIREDGGICVKTHYEKGFGGRGDLPVPSLDLVNQLVAEAHDLGMPVLLHANSESAQTFGNGTGVDAFAHGMWTWNDRSATQLHDGIESIVDESVAKDIALQPTVQVLYGEQDIHDPDYLSGTALRHVVPQSLIDWYSTEDGQWWRQRMLRIPIVARLVDEGRWQELDAPPIARVSAVIAYFAEQGGTLIFGSDTPSDPTFANPPGLNGRYEMDRWIAAGVSAPVLFRAATIGNAEFFGLADRLGRVEQGKRADLLLTRQNPLASVTAYDSIEYVVLAGELFERGSLSATATAR